MRSLILAFLCIASLPPAAHAQDLGELRRRAGSDDAQTPQEAAFHAEARARVIRSLEPNPLAVGGGAFRVKRNPSGAGCFVYEPNTSFAGVERFLVWWVNEQGAAFPVNGASKPLTPTLPFPSVGTIQPADQIVDYVFSDEPLAPLNEVEAPPTSGGFTVTEYHAYRLVIDAPLSIPEEQAVERAAACLQVTTAAVTEGTGKVQQLLLANGWFGQPQDEVRRASDWSGEPPTPPCR